MLLLMMGLVLGLWLYNRAPRLQAADSDTSVRAYVDGKPAEAYVKED